MINKKRSVEILLSLILSIGTAASAAGICSAAIPAHAQEVQMSKAPAQDAQCSGQEAEPAVSDLADAADTEGLAEDAAAADTAAAGDDTATDRTDTEGAAEAADAADTEGMKADEAAAVTAAAGDGTATDRTDTEGAVEAANAADTEGLAADEAAAVTAAAGDGRAADTRAAGDEAATEQTDTEGAVEAANAADTEGLAADEAAGDTAAAGDGTATEQTDTEPSAAGQTATEPASTATAAEPASTATVAASAPAATAVKIVKLGSPANIRWENVTTLRWNAVKKASKYQIVLTVKSGSVKYTKTITVKDRTSYDLESKIVSIIKAHKSKFKGAAYSVFVKVKAVSTNTSKYKNGSAVKSPTMRYLKTTYDEAVSRNGWYRTDGDWYYYIGGKKQTGWITFQKLRYYLDEDGKLVTDSWIGKRYVKSNGEMARDEWVEGYQTYVNEKGLKDDSVKFRTNNWVQNKKGWRYKKSSGGYYKNQWKTIGHRLYYFDKNGYVKTGWATIDGKKYHFKATGDIAEGLGARETGWVKAGSSYYWCDEDGVLATNTWVDRSQYYVGSKGKRVETLTYQNLRNVNTSNRLGYMAYALTSAPEQSVAGYDLAYRNGNRIFVVDLRFTKDNVPVCFHDDLVGYARNANGRVPAAKPSVSGLTLAELNKYDYGIYRGAAYAGTRALTLEEMAKWMKNHKDADMYVEVKADKMNAAQIANTVKILKKYGVTDRSSMVFGVSNDSDTRAKRVHKAAPTLRIGFMGASVNSTVLKQAASAKGTKNEVFLYCWGVKEANTAKTKLTSAIVKKLREKDINYECGTFSGQSSIDAIMKYYAVGSAYSYNTGVETYGAVFKNELMEATCHEKSHWVTVQNGRKYMQVDRTYAKKTWVTVGSKKYYVNSSGYMVTGWLSQGGNRYYLDENGVMVTGTRTIDGKKYKFGKDGALVK